MSFLESLFGSFTDSDDSSSASVQHPCSNCPSNCAVYPEACPVCQPYKEKMIDALYNVEHKDEILAKYEVVGTSDAAATGFITCPYCGGQSANPYVCEYCDSKLQDGSAKVKVSSARPCGPSADEYTTFHVPPRTLAGFTPSNTAAASLT